MGRTNAIKEKEGLWEVHEQLLSKSAALQARLKEADDEQSRLQQLSAECAALKDKLHFAQTEREELMSLRARIEGQLQETRDKCSALEEQLRSTRVETFSVVCIYTYIMPFVECTRSAGQRILHNSPPGVTPKQKQFESPKILWSQF